MVNDVPSRVSVKSTAKKRSSPSRQSRNSVFAAAFGFSVFAAVLGSACTSPWCPGGTAAIAMAFDATFGLGYGHQRHRRPSCELSGDPEYPCRVSRPPNAFDGEIALYFSGDEDNLSVKIVVPGVTRPGSAGGGTGWAALGFSPDGRMAGPSEADVGFLGAGGNLEGNSVLRYWMDGYSASSVVPLSECDQVLTDGRVHSTDDGSLVVSFRRPWTAALRPPRHEQSCAEAGEEAAGSADGEEGIGCFDPRENGVVVLWAYSLRGAWPSYHDANGAFVLPQMAGYSRLDGQALLSE